MASGTGGGTDERLIQALERLTRINESISALHREAIQVRTRVRELDMNVEALSMLASAKSKDEKGDGKLVLVDLFKYAQQAGIQLEVQENRVPLPSREVTLPEPKSEFSVENHEKPARMGVLKLLTQLTLAIAVTSGLFVLIH